MSKQPVYSNEFKADAVAKALEIGVNKTAEQLGIGVSTIHKWKANHRKSSNINSKLSYEALEKENRRLRRELKYVNDINDILKKSAAIFCKDQMGDLR